jgi:hypothetical protein
LLQSISQSYQTVKPTLNIKLFFNIFSDDWGSGRKIHDTELEGDTQIHVLDYLIASTEAIKKIDLSHFSSVELLDHYRETFDIARDWNRRLVPQKMRKQGKQTAEKVRNLKQNEFLLIPGGWLTKLKGGHALMYQAYRDDSGQYFFRILNSGAGLNFHTTGEKQDFYNPGVEWGPLSAEQVADENFWIKLVEYNQVAKTPQGTESTYDAHQLYAMIHRQFSSVCPKPKPVKNLPDIQSQRAGTCSRKSIDLIGRISQEVNTYKKSRIEQKLVALIMLHEYLKNEELSIAEKQTGWEIFRKGYRKLWVSMAKQVERYGATETPLATTLQELGHQVAQDDMRVKIELEMDQLIANKISVDPEKVKAEVEKAKSLFTGTPFLASEHAEFKALDVGIHIPEKLNIETIEKLTLEINEVADFIQNKGKSLSYDEQLGFLNAAIFSRLPFPEAKGGSVWQRNELWNPKEIIPVKKLLESLKRVSELFLKTTSDSFRNKLPEQALNLWKVFAIATCICRGSREIARKFPETPVLWAYLSQLQSSELMPLCNGPHIKELQTLIDFFRKDSPNGEKFVGIHIDSQNGKYETIPLFDYSWKEVDKERAREIPEIMAYSYNDFREIKMDKDSLFYYWQQLSGLAQLAADSNNHREDADLNIHVKKENGVEKVYTDKPSFQKPLKLSQPFSDFVLYNDFDAFKFNLSHQVKHSQAESMKEKRVRDTGSVHESYQMQVTSTAEGEVSIALLLDMFERRRDLLLSRDYLNFFMLHLHKGDRVYQSMLAEPQLKERLVTFLAEVASQQLKDMRSESNFEVLIHMFYSLTLIDPEDSKQIFEKTLQTILNISEKRPEWSGLASAIYLAHHHLIGKDPPLQEYSKMLFLFQRYNYRQDNPFVHRLRSYASALIQSKLSEILNKLKVEETRKVILKPLNTFGKEDLPFVENGDNTLKNTWMINENFLYLDCDGDVIEFDFLQGIAYFNGIPEGSTSLPPDIRNDMKNQFFGHAINGAVIYGKQGWTLKKPGFDQVLFSNRSGRCVQMKYIQKDYQLSESELSSIIYIPQCLDKTNLSAWPKISSGQTEMLLCSHVEGAPIPRLMIDDKGAIHPVDHPELSLCERLPKELFNIFKGICCNPFEALAWVDAEGVIQKVELPLKSSNGSKIAFLPGKNGWHWMEHPEYFVDEIQDVAEFLNDPFHLNVRKEDGERMMMLPIRLYGELVKRTSSKTATIDLLGSGNDIPVAKLFPITSKGIIAETLEERLTLAYRQLMSGNYLEAKELLIQGIRPLGRPYTENEINLLNAIIESDKEKADKSSEASALKLYCLYNFREHFDTYPLRNNEIPQSCKSTDLIIDLIGNYYRGAETSDSIKLTTLMTKEERMRLTEILGNLRTHPHLKNFNYALKLINEDYVQPKKEIPGGWKTQQFAMNTLRNRISIYRDLWKDGDDNRDFMSALIKIDGYTKTIDAFYTYSDFGFRYIFREAYTLAKNREPNKQQERNELRNVLAERLYEIYGDSERVRSTNRGVIYALLFLVIDISDPSTLPELPDIEVSSREDYLAKIFWNKLGKLVVEKLPEKGIESTEYSSGIWKKKDKVPHSPGVIQDILNRWKSVAVDSDNDKIEWDPNALKQFGDVDLDSYLAQDKMTLEECTERYERPNSRSPLVKTEEWKKLSDNEKNILQPFITDLEEYQKEVDGNPGYRIKKGSIEKIKENTEKFAKKLQDEADALADEILTLANKLPSDRKKALGQSLREQSTNVSVLDIEACIGLTLRGKMELWMNNTYLSPNEIEILNNKVIAYLYLSTELQHAERGIALINKAGSNPNEEELKAMGEWRSSKRTYAASSVELLVYEHRSGFRVWDRQAKILQKMMQSDASGRSLPVVLQLIMGSGKSKLLAPVSRAARANGKLISTYCLPPSLFETGKMEMSKSLYEFFRVRSEVLDFERKDCNVRKLEQIIFQLDRVEREGRVLITTSKPLLSLMRQMLVERAELILQCKSQYKIQEYVKEQELIIAIMKRVDDKMDILYDEFDTIFDPRNRLALPVGAPRKANTIGVREACNLYFEILPKFENQLNICDGGQTLIAGTSGMEEIKQKIVDDLWNRFNSDCPKNHEGFNDYILNKSTDGAKAFSKELRRYRTKDATVSQKRTTEEIAFYRYALSPQGLDQVFNVKAHVRYGLSKIDPYQKIAIPWNNGSPKEGTRFGSEWEGCLKTCQYYRHTWDRPDDTRKLLQFNLQNKGAAEDIRAIFDDPLKIDVDNPNNEETMIRYTENLQKALQPDHPHFHSALKLVKEYLIKVFSENLEFDAVTLEGNAFDLGDIGHPMGFSGTRRFHHTWPNRFEGEATSHTDSITIDALLDKHNTQCSIVNPNSFIDQLLVQRNIDEVGAIVDLASLSSDITPTAKARKILQIASSEDAQKLGVHKKAVLYFERSSRGRDQFALLRSDHGDPIFLSDTNPETIKRALGDIPTSDIFTYFGLAQTVGIDIGQQLGFRALVTIDDQSTYEHLFQAVARMRKLYERGHNITFIISTKVAEKISQVLDKPIDEIESHDVIRFTILMQEQQEKNLHPDAVLESMRFYVRRLARIKLQNCPPQQRIEFYNANRNIFISEKGESLFFRFGSIQNLTETKEVLALELEMLSYILQEIDPQNAASHMEKLQAIIDTALEKVPMPEKILSNQRIAEGAIETERTVDAENQRQAELMQESDQAYSLQDRNPGKVDIWPDAKDLGDFLTKKIDKIILRPFNEFCEVKRKWISNEILVTSNFLFPFEGILSKPFTRDLPPLHHLLVFFENNFPHIVILSKDDSEQLVKRLNSPELNIGNRSCFIIEPHGQLVQSDKRSNWENPFTSKDAKYSLLKPYLIQAMLLKGDAIRLSKKQYRAELEAYVNQTGQGDEMRGDFEKILAQRSEDLEHFLKKQKLRAAFNRPAMAAM